ncbi:hypothetical protein AVEN_67795-1 [Araneus ventricosus]|uniref:Uncharacterized protein n=1 Tax=Araneus ventricosus TaxID=182803 RepID=A0A4Y2J599_ARAVE|nr:hypothetical protein AVEN_67795-1 [Araneus ventricosus]
MTVNGSQKREKKCFTPSGAFLPSFSREPFILLRMIEERKGLPTRQNITDDYSKLCRHLFCIERRMFSHSSPLQVDSVESLVLFILASRFEETRRLLWGAAVVIFNCCQTTRMTPEPVPPSPNFRTTSAR